MTQKNLPRAAIAAALSSLALAATPLAHAQVSIGVGINIAPPPLPYYVQPPIPGDGYIWTPGYWSWDPAAGDYVWVTGTWVLPPAVGLLWTPGYWAFYGGGYRWHRGYWGPHVGYYGGINYGYGYGGHGYAGGHWDRGHFAYNRAVNNVPEGRVHAAYGRPMAVRPMPAHDSFNGRGSHFTAPPTAAERRFEDARHGQPTPEQLEHEHRAVATPEQRMANNHGMPPIAATPRPSGFGEPGFERGRSEQEMRQAPHEVRPPAPREMHVPTPPMRAPQPTMEAPRGAPGGGGGPRMEGGRGGGRPEGGRPGGHPGGHDER